MTRTEANPRKILIVQTAFLGDVVLITPLIKSAAAIWPAASIDVLVIPQTRTVLANNPNIRKILVFDKRKGKVRAFWQIWRELYSGKYDLAITPHSSFTTILLLLLAGIPARVGFDRWLARFFLTRKVPHLTGIHKVKKNLHLLSVFTDREFSGQTELFPSADDRLWAGNQIRAGLAGTIKPLIALAPGSVWFTKRWPASHYIHLTRKLGERGFRLVFIGGPEEKDLIDSIITEAGVAALNLAGQATILQSAAILEMCALLICNDSGALHIGNAVQTPVFAFFGPTVQSIGYFPFGAKDKVFEEQMACRPCSKHGGVKCPLGHHECMTKINPDFVFNEVLKKTDLSATSRPVLHSPDR